MRVRSGRRGDRTASQCERMTGEVGNARLTYRRRLARRSEVFTTEEHNLPLVRGSPSTRRTSADQREGLIRMRRCLRAELQRRVVPASTAVRPTAPLTMMLTAALDATSGRTRRGLSGLSKRLFAEVAQGDAFVLVLNRLQLCSFDRVQCLAEKIEAVAEVGVRRTLAIGGTLVRRRAAGDSESTPSRCATSCGRR